MPTNNGTHCWKMVNLISSGSHHCRPNFDSDTNCRKIAENIENVSVTIVFNLKRRITGFIGKSFERFSKNSSSDGQLFLAIM